MRSLTETSRKFLILILVLSAVIFVVGFFFAKSPFAWFLGILIGTLASLLRIVMLERSINASLDMTSKAATGYARAQFSLRYGLTLLVLVLAGVSGGRISLFGAIGGLLSMSFAAYLMKFFIKDKTENLNL